MCTAVSRFYRGTRDLNSGPYPCPVSSFTRWAVSQAPAVIFNPFACHGCTEKLIPAFLNESRFSPLGSNIIEGLKACHFHNLLESCSDNSTLKALALSSLHTVSIGKGESCYFFLFHIKVFCFWSSIQPESGNVIRGDSFLSWKDCHPIWCRWLLGTASYSVVPSPTLPLPWAVLWAPRIYKKVKTAFDLLLFS